MRGFGGWKGVELGAPEGGGTPIGGDGGENGPMEEGGADSAASYSEPTDDWDESMAGASAASFSEPTDIWDSPKYNDLPITLAQIELLQGTFPPDEINFLKTIFTLMQTEYKKKEFTIIELNTYVSKLVENASSPFVVNALNIARTIAYLNNKIPLINSEFNSSRFYLKELRKSDFTVVAVAHGDMFTENGKISSVYPYEPNPNLLSITTETVAGCGAYNYLKLTEMLSKACLFRPGAILNKSNKEEFRNFLNQKLTPYVGHLQQRITKMQNKLLLSEDEKEKFNQYLSDYAEITAILKGKTFATYNPDSVEFFNTPFENKKPNETGYASSGIHIIPGEPINSGISKFIYKYLNIKLSNQDPDTQYYVNIIGQIQDFDLNNIDHIKKFFELMIGDITHEDHYGFSIYKMPDAQLGSLMFEVVKHYVFQTNDHNMYLLFWVNFELDNLAFKLITSSDYDDTDRISHLAQHIRKLTSPHSLKYAELATILKILGICGNFDLVLQSCLNTPDPDALKKLSEHAELTQSESDFGSQSTQLLYGNGGGGGGDDDMGGGGDDDMGGGGRGIKNKRHGKKKTRRKQKPQKTKHKKKQIKKSKKHITKMRKTIKK